MKSENNFSFIGNDLSLDFVNTVGNILSDAPREKLSTYADLAAWGELARITSAGETAALLAAARSDPDGAHKILERAKRLRKSIYRIFSSVASNLDPAPEDLSRLNEELSRAMSQAEVFKRGDDFVWSWRKAEPDAALSRVARAAADLLVNGDLKRIGRCSDEVCGWLFYDTSKNRHRRWCDMRDCGNLAKARRFRLKE